MEDKGQLCRGVCVRRVGGDPTMNGGACCSKIIRVPPGKEGPRENWHKSLEVCLELSSYTGNSSCSGINYIFWIPSSKPLLAKMTLANVLSC